MVSFLKVAKNNILLCNIVYLLKVAKINIFLGNAMVSFYVLYILCICHYIIDKSWLPYQNLNRVKCFLSTSLNKKCKRTIKDLKNISEFDDEKRKLLMLHCGLESISPICYYHERVYYVHRVLYLIETARAQSTGAGGYCLSEKV